MVAPWLERYIALSREARALSASRAIFFVHNTLVIKISSKLKFVWFKNLQKENFVIENVLGHVASYK